MSSPGLLLRTLLAVITNPKPALALGTPVAPIAGVQPCEFNLAVQYATPEEHGSKTATVRSPPAATSTKRRPPGSAGMVHCPLSFLPHALTEPSLRSATVCAVPAATPTYDWPAGSAGTLHCPEVF